MGIFNEQTQSNPFSRGIQGAPGVGFRLTPDGNFDITGKKLTNVGAPAANSDAATKKYVDDTKTSHTSSGLTVNSNIDMKDTYRILNLKSPSDADEPATKQYADSTFLDRGGNRGMIANLVMNNYRIKRVADPTSSTDATTKRYVDNLASTTLNTATSSRNIDMQNKFRITNLQTPVDPHEPPTKSYVDNTFLERDGSYPMTGNLNMGNHKITGLRAPTVSSDATSKKYVDDSITNASPDLSDYLEKDGSVTMTGNLNMGSKKIVNLAEPTSNTDAATKKYVDDNSGGGGSGDFKKDGSVAMTGNLNMGSNRIVSLADPINPSDVTNVSWVKNQIQHFNVLYSPVFTITPAPAYTTIYFQYQSNKFIATTSTPGRPLASWKPASGTYINKMEFNFNRSIYVKKISFVARDSSTSSVDFWLSHTYTSPYTLKIHRTFNYELSGVLLEFVTDANSNHPPITTKIFTGKPSAATKDFNKITFNSPCEFTSTTTAIKPTASNQVATKEYVDRSVAGPAHYKNIFEYLMSSAAQWSDEITTRTSFVIDRFGDLSANSGNFHSYNHKVAYFILKKYSGGYKFKIGLNFYRLSSGEYTICLEFLTNDYTLWHKTLISADHQSSSGITFHSETVKKLTHTYYYPISNIQYMYYHRVIISFTKNSSGRSFLHVTVNIPQVGIDMNIYPNDFKKYYVIAYGINGAFGNIDPDRSYDYHTAFDIQPSQVSYNVPIVMNNKAITNLAVDQNSNSAATVGIVKELRQLLPLYYYYNVFEEFWDFKIMSKYETTGLSSSSSFSFNKLRGVKDETKKITFPSKNIDRIDYRGLDIFNYNVDIPLDYNTTNLCIMIVFYFWPNNNFTITRTDTNSNSKLFEVKYDKLSKRFLLYSGTRNSSYNIPVIKNGEKNVLWITQTFTTTLKFRFGTSNTFNVVGFGRITPRNQKVTFYAEGGFLNKVMIKQNSNTQSDNIIMQEKLV